jgi:hypothetical protein
MQVYDQNSWKLSLYLILKQFLFFSRSLWQILYSIYCKARARAGTARSCIIFLAGSRAANYSRFMDLLLYYEMQLAGVRAGAAYFFSLYILYIYCFQKKGYSNYPSDNSFLLYNMLSDSVLSSEYMLSIKAALSSGQLSNRYLYHTSIYLITCDLILCEQIIYIIFLYLII